MLAPELSIQGKIFTDSIGKADRIGPHERTPSDWESEFLAQQTAAFSDDTANPISHDTTGKERTPSEWESEFLAQQTAAFSDETANPINDDTTGKCTDDGPGTYHSPKCYSRLLLLFHFHDLCPLTSHDVGGGGPECCKQDTSDGSNQQRRSTSYFG